MGLPFVIGQLMLAAILHYAYEEDAYGDVDAEDAP
jgi:hypothetical protein